MNSKIGVALLVGSLLTGCSAAATAPEPTPSKVITFSECAKLVFEDLKKEFGVEFLIDKKTEATAIVKKTCENQPHN
jgi:hypothetical protein